MLCTQSTRREVYYMHGHQRCGHHVLAKILVVLAWLAAIGFWWVSWTGRTAIWGMNAEHLFRDVIILAILAFSTKFCGCYQKSMMTGMCGCACNNCEGGKCDGNHKEDHQHM